MDFSFNDISSVIVVITGWVSMYAGFRAKVSVLEQEVTNLKEMVSELRYDVKKLLFKKHC